MRNRFPLLLLSVFLIVWAAGCSTGEQPVTIPTVAALPTVTPSNTPVVVPPTWTPSPTPPPTCDRVIADTVQSARAVCSSAATGEACFVASRAGLTLRENAAAPAFAVPGDRAALTLLNRLDTTAYDPLSYTWGMALLNVQADPPDIAPGQWVAVAVYGEATVFDTGDGSAPFQSMAVHTGFADPQCANAPLPGVLLQNATGDVAGLTVNGLPLRFRGTLLVRAQGQGVMQLAVLAGSARVTVPGGNVLDVVEGAMLQTPLGGESGYVALGPVTIHPLDTALTAFLPLVSLPQAVAVAPPVLATADAPLIPQDVATALPFTPTPTSPVPFVGTPPGGAYLTYSGRRIELEQRVTGAVGPGERDVWVFTPHGLGPDATDYFEVEGLSDWDPVITVESATWGVYEPHWDTSDGNVEVYSGSLAGSGGDWRIIITGARDTGGSYILRYTCFGPCPAEPPPPQ